MDAGVRFVAVDNAAANELTLHILAAVAQAERKAISQRTKEALAAAKARGVKLGNPNLAEARRQINESRKQQAQEFAETMRPAIEYAKQAGSTSIRAIAKWLNNHSYRTSTGSAWSAMAVKRVQSRI